MRVVTWASSRSRPAKTILLGIVLFALSNVLGGPAEEDTIQFAFAETLGTVGLVLTLCGIAWLYFSLDATPNR